MRKTLVLLLAGGVGSRLNILAHYRAKPAVPFGGIYRIIDFTLSNARNSGLVNVGVLTQYKPLSLMDHIGNGAPWDFMGRMRGARILPPRTGEKDSDWYRGTADAIRQNTDYIRNFKPERVLVLSGDHIYSMDYSRLVAFHKSRGADLTIAMMRVPQDQTHHFGIGITDENDRLVEWEEKPRQASSNLASMGVYIFNADYLFEILKSIPEHDFGKHMIPHAIQSSQVYAYPFNGYWRDVGTLHAYWDANMDLLRPNSGLDLSQWKVYTNLEEEGMAGDRPPIRIMRGAQVENSYVSQGCVIEGAVINSVLSPGVRVRRAVSVRDSVVMHDAVIESGSELDHVIVDKQVHIAANCRIGFGDRSTPNRRFSDHLKEGLTVIGKNARVPADTTLGTNCIVYPKATEEDFSGSHLGDGETVEPAS